MHHIYGFQRFINTERSFGFIKYHNFEEAENCIRGFYYRKYEAKFARVKASLSVEDVYING